MWKEIAFRLLSPLFCAVTVIIPESRELTADPDTSELGIGNTLAYSEKKPDGTTEVHIPTGGTVRITIDGREIDVADRARGDRWVEIHEEGGIDHTLKITGQYYESSILPGVIVRNEGPIENEAFPKF